jgi:hypothetical protein
VAARTKSLIVVAVLVVTGGLKASGYPGRTVAGDLQVSGTPIPKRIVSLVPSLTEMLFATTRTHLKRNPALVLERCSTPTWNAFSRSVPILC